MYVRRGYSRALLGITVATLVLAPGTSTGAQPGHWTAADVNAAVARGVAYLDAQQNPDGSFGSGAPAAETAFAIIAYGVLDGGDYTNLPPAYQDHLRSAVNYLLGQQNPDGSFGGFYHTYTSGLALAGLAASTGITPGIPDAIANGRTWLIMNQNAPPAVTGNPSSPECSVEDQPPPGTGSDTYCGGWNYEAGFGRSDESNTGFALTGLRLTGGVPTGTATYNVGWQRHIQQLMATNYFATRNDGGGGYDVFGSFSSNANNTGSLLFGLGYSLVPDTDQKVQAALAFGTDVLDEYELMKATVRSGIYHFGMERDGTCVIGDAGCTWAIQGDGGYHYGLWALTKGFGQYIPPVLSDPSNWYAKVVDLLLTEQSPDGSWPVDGRDDFSNIVATSFAVDALGLVGVDVKRPTCRVTARRPGPPAEIDITVQDTDSGLALVELTSTNNAIVNVPPFERGTTSPVVLTATKLDEGMRAAVGLRVFDVAGNVTRCTSLGVIPF